ncbi:1260_t:CDS:1 [Cetraspora pellucida]|uniref:1260_t:CDS:1 n=1 Tax=Cetraspora pellucida TaxID=1433469 RepID=A0A9N9HX03_9GLOM|nr:1260_t:CDS:1 [Cetraspora pellucida]
MNNRISYLSENDNNNIYFTSSSNKYINDAFSITEYANKDKDEYANKYSTLSVIKNAKNDNIFYCNGFENEFNLLPAIENVKNSNLEDEPKEYEGGGSENKPKDSFLKEINAEQIFTSFEVLKQCLKHYSTKMNFETKIVQVEKKNNVCTRKMYKC